MQAGGRGCAVFNPINLLPIMSALALLLGGFGVGWAWQGARADARVLAIESQHQQAQLDIAATWQAEVARKQAVADDLARGLAKAEQARTIVYKEIVREIPATTLGRPCLSGDALGLLDRFAVAASGGPPETAGQPVDTAAAAATDTQVAQWAAESIEQHERERARCNALIDWHE